MFRFHQRMGWKIKLTLLVSANSGRDLARQGYDLRAFGSKRFSQLKISKMKRSILKSHGIKSIELSNGIILAIEEDLVIGKTNYTNVTKMTIKKLYEWLGY